MSFMPLAPAETVSARNFASGSRSDGGNTARPEAAQGTEFLAVVGSQLADLGGLQLKGSHSDPAKSC